MSWYTNALYSSLGSRYPDITTATQQMMQNSIKDGTCAHRTISCGTLTDISLKEFIDFFLAKQARISSKAMHVSDVDNPHAYMLTWYDTHMDFTFNSCAGYMELHLVSTNKELFAELCVFIVKHVIPESDEPEEGTIMVVTKGRDGPHLTDLGVGSVKYIPENYNADSVAHFAHVVKDLSCENPCGRIVILEGIPGTGKTYLIRSLISQVPDATFLLISASHLEELVGPDMINLLIAQKSTGMPLCLIIEDGDSCLVKRSGTNMSLMSSLLNLSDGIMGHLLDLRVIITTNAGHLADESQIDPAIMRDGRLCKKFVINPLTIENANKRYQSLTKTNQAPFTQPTPLATVYKRAKEIQ